MSFFQRFKTAWKIAKGLRYCVNSDEHDFWTDDNARNTKMFFESEAGKKLSIRLTNYAIKMALAAVQDSSGEKNGDARGVTACIAAIEMHHPQVQEPSTEEMPSMMETIEA